MTTTYKAVVLKGKGGFDQLEIQDLPLVEPKAGELRVRVRASGAGSTDTIMRTGFYPFAPKFPFSPGYEVVGEVDAIGPDVTGVTLGQRVCALTVYGGQAEYLVREAKHFVPVPDGLDDGEVVALILNYVTAYQMIHRTAKMTAGQSALVTGANGGVGSAAIELCKDIGVRALGAAAQKHFDLVRDLGGEPIPARTVPLDEAVHAVLPEGVDVSLDGLGGAASRECIRATKKGGLVVGYGFMAAHKEGKTKTSTALRGMIAVMLGAKLSGRRSAWYGITKLYRKNIVPFHEDLPRLFELLAARKIRPRIAVRLPLLAGVEAQRMLDAGGIAGKIVLERARGLT
jgi:NADPH:quinone reductase-like Zn-dependent oxidoreductase